MLCYHSLKCQLCCQKFAAFYSFSAISEGWMTELPIWWWGRVVKEVNPPKWLRSTMGTVLSSWWVCSQKLVCFNQWHFQAIPVMDPETGQETYMIIDPQVHTLPVHSIVFYFWHINISYCQGLIPSKKNLLFSDSTEHCWGRWGTTVHHDAGRGRCPGGYKRNVKKMTWI